MSFFSVVTVHHVTASKSLSYLATVLFSSILDPDAVLDYHKSLATTRLCQVWPSAKIYGTLSVTFYVILVANKATEMAEVINKPFDK